MRSNKIEIGACSHRRTQGVVSGVKPPPLKNSIQPYRQYMVINRFNNRILVSIVYRTF